MTFVSEDARRQHFIDLLREKLKDPEFRKVEGFPVGKDEYILALSDPPYYTACPNPWVIDFIRQYGKVDDPNTPYRREPFAADVSEGKSDAIYNAHSYHTKVPHKAIMRYVLHYTEPGDTVLDAFCGTGMTGIAAQSCANRAEVEALGYSVQKNGQITDSTGGVVSKLGARLAVLGDLSPAATFIASNYNISTDVAQMEKEANRILDEVEEEFGWMYKTRHGAGPAEGDINFVVWSEIHNCPECSRELVFLEEALDRENSTVREEFPCPHCKASLAFSRLELAYVSRLDPALGKTTKAPKRVPAIIDYVVGNRRHEKKPDKHDLALIDRILQMPIPAEVPTTLVPDMQMMRVGRMRTTAVTHIHHFFFARTAHILAAFWRRANAVSDHRVRQLLLFWLESQLVNLSVRNRYRPGVSFPYNPLTGVLYVPSMVSEASVFTAYRNKLKRILKAFDGFCPSSRLMCLQTGSASVTGLPEASIDYVFTDPPFGENIYYSDLNFFIEAWLGVFTSTKPEAIVDRVKEKGLVDYQRLMARCFAEYYRVLKPGRWMTVEFHNSKNSVWNAIQEALQHAGFVVADVRTLDKQQGSFQQVVSGGAVKQDLVISVYKPTVELERKFKLDAGTEDGAWAFVRSHLGQLPVFVSKGGDGEPVAERQGYLLFDRMVAFHVQRGTSVPLSLSEFYAGLQQKFAEREGMFFLPDQAAEFDRRRMSVSKLRQLQLFVTDESSAIQWVRQQLTDKPQSFKELQPQFMKEVAGWEKHEQPLELLEMLRQNFLCYDGAGDVPNPIHAYLSSNFKELRNLQKSHATLREKAKERWYVPDPHKAGDLEKLRERALLAEFEEYKASKQRNLKVFRTEAVRAGFKAAYDRQDYKTVVAVAAKLPETVLQEDEKLLMYFDVATMRLGDVDKDKLFQ